MQDWAHGWSMTLKETAKSSPLLAGVLAFFLTVYPPVQAYFLGGTAAIITFFAADAFYYLSIAVHSTFGKYSFDGVTLTNGFHPLWQILLQIVVSHLQVKSGLPPVLASFSLSILATGLGVAFLAAGVSRLSRAVWPVFLLFPGFYFWLAAPIDARFGSVWSFVNGMESPLSILFFGLFFLLLVRQWRMDAVVPLLLLSVTSLLVVLSRLDDVFLVAVFAVWLGLTQRKLAGLSAAIRSVAIYLAPVVMGLGIYLVFNLRTVGVLLPTSGMVKSDHLGVIKNLVWLVVVGLPFAGGILRHFSSQIPAQITGIILGWHLLQMLAPMAIAAALMVFRQPIQWIGRGEAPKLRMLLSYILAKGGYNLFFVPLMRQGHWYYAVSIIVLNTVAALAVARAVEHYDLVPSTLRWAVVLPVLCVAWLSTSTAVWRVLNDATLHKMNAEVYERGPLLRSELQARLGSIHMIEFDDGILNYAMATPTLSGFGLAADAKTAQALKSGTLLSYSASRGFNLLGSANYALPLANASQVSSDELRKALHESFFLRDEVDLNQFNFSVAYVDPLNHTQFIQFTRK